MSENSISKNPIIGIRELDITMIFFHDLNFEHLVLSVEYVPRYFDQIGKFFSSFLLKVLYEGSLAEVNFLC